MNIPTIARTTVNPAIALAIAVGLLASIALAVVTLNAGRSAPAIGSQAAPADPVKVYGSDRSGVGLAGPTISRSVATFKAHTHPYAGEGRVNVAALRAIDALPLITYQQPPGMGEGWFGGMAKPVTVAPFAYSSCGQGEGLVQHGVPVEKTCR